MPKNPNIVQCGCGKGEALLKQQMARALPC